jgi:transposase
MKITPEILKEKEAIIESQSRDIEDLKLQIKWLKNVVFGSTSEKQSVQTDAEGQAFLPYPEALEIKADDLQYEQSQTAESKSKKKTKKKSSNQLVFPSNLEIENIMIDLPADEKVDPITGKAYSILDTEIIEKLTLTPSKFKLIRFHRPIYGCGKSGINKMDMPLSIFPNHRVDASIISDVMVKRFCDHLPFYRQSEIYARDGFNVTRQTLDKWFLDTAQALAPLVVLLKKEILKSHAIYVDETGVKLQKKGNKKLHQAYMWVLCGSPPGTQAPLVWLYFEENRKHENAQVLIEDFSGVVHSDVYGAYETMAALGTFVWAPCWVHARRKFVNATEGSIRTHAIKLIDQLQRNERLVWEMTAEERTKFRKDIQAPIVNEFIEYITEKQSSMQVMLSKSLGLACNYFLKRKDHFKNFLSQPNARMENNTAERAVRPLAIGRKNWLFAGSKDGGQAAAGMYSLLQSCRNLGVNPREYLTDVLRNMPYTTADELHTLLPQNWKAQINPSSDYLPFKYKA